MAWAEHDPSYMGDYEIVEITHSDMVQIFSGVVHNYIKLIKAQHQGATSPTNVQHQDNNGGGRIRGLQVLDDRDQEGI